MVYDPIKKREYDRIRNAQLKAEYLAKNPNYNPKKKSKYEDTPPITQSSSFNSFIDLYTPPPPLPQKPKYNPNGLEAKKREDAYSDEEVVMKRPLFQFY